MVLFQFLNFTKNFILLIKTFNFNMLLITSNVVHQTYMDKYDLIIIIQLELA